MISLEEIKVNKNGSNIINNISLDIKNEQWTIITGESGAGKSTLLNVIAGIERPAEGAYYIDSMDILSMDKKERHKMLGSYFGHVFQSDRLMNNLSIEDNIKLVTVLGGFTLDNCWYEELVEKLDISNQTKKFPTQLSGGQRQRVSIARALLKYPKVLLADEPTARLDSENKIAVHNLLQDIASTSGMGIIMVSHDEISNNYADNHVVMSDGIIKA